MDTFMNILITLQPICIIIFIYSTMIYMGSHMTLKQIGNEFKHPRPLIMAFILNIIISPLIAIGVGMLFGVSNVILTAILLINLFAGAPAGPKNVDLANGDRTLSVTTVFVLSISVLIIVPFSSQLFFKHVDINSMQILMNLVILVLIPLGIGMIMRGKWPKAADKVMPIMTKISTIFMVLVLIVYIIPNIMNIINDGLIMIAVSATIILVTFVLSYIFTFGTAAERKTISLITITKNFGIALSMASLPMFAGENLTSYMMSYIIVLLVISLVLSLLLRKVGDKKKAS